MTDSKTDAASTDSIHEQAGVHSEVRGAVFGAARTARIANDDQADEDLVSQRNPEREQTLLEQMGGVVGLVSSTIPVVVFIMVNALTELTPAIWAAVVSAVLIAGWRLLRKEPIQPALSGVLGVAICAFIAYRTGSAKGFFLFGIWTSLIYGGAFLLSAAVRWPLAGVVWSVLNGNGFEWRTNPKVLRAYDLATLAWTLVFTARFVVQRWLYDTDQTGWLAVARIGMGYPLMGLALLVTVWAVRQERKLMPAEEPAAADIAEEPGSAG
jgi:Protein of unknown function (DUF3159)